MSTEHTLEDRLNEDLKASMRERDAERRSVIQMIRSQILLEKKRGGGGGGPGDERILQLIQSHAKKLEDALEHAQQAGRDDLVEKTNRELSITRSYLPAQLSDQDLEAIVGDVVSGQSEKGPRAMGQVMKVVMERVRGQADGKRVQAAVRKALGMG